MIFTVKQARKYAGKTQSEMAEALKIHKDTYRKIENNPKTATIDQAKKIADFTGIEFDQIFFAQ